MANIGVFFGSRSPEHDVSILTGQLIISGLKKLGHQVVPVYITKSGEWCVGEEVGSLKFFQNPRFEEKLEKYNKFSLDLKKSKGKLILVRKRLFSKKEITIDIAFPALHGQHGEDGTIQGLFEMFNVPYVGCDVPSSAITMDKVLTKLMYQIHGLPTTKFIYFSKKEWAEKTQELLNRLRTELRWPLFIKPARLGSSIGISKAKDEKTLQFAIEVALHYDSKVLVEESVENMIDITCSVLGNENPQPSHLQEASFEGSDFFSYEEKYLKEGGAQVGNATKNIIIPARISTEKTREIQDMAVKVHVLLGLTGFSRIDFLYDKTDGAVYVNEVNPLPGTLYHHLWKASGIEFDTLLSRLIELAKERHEIKQKLTFTFESNILKVISSSKLQSKLQ